MTSRHRRLLPLGLLLVGGCTLYDTDELALSIRAAPRASTTLYVEIRAPDRVAQVWLSVDGARLPEAYSPRDGAPVDVSAYPDRSRHVVQASTTVGTQTVTSPPLEFEVDRTPPTASWTPPPGTVGLEPGQVFRATFSEPVVGPVRVAVAGNVTSQPVRTVGLAPDGQSLELALDDRGDANDWVSISLAGVTDVAGNSAAPTTARWDNTPFTVALSTGATGDIVWGPLTLTATVVGASPSTTVRFDGTYTDTNGFPTGVAGPTLSAPFAYLAAASRGYGKYVWGATATSGNRVTTSRPLTFWYTSGPPTLQCAGPFGEDLADLGAHDTITCRYQAGGTIHDLNGHVRLLDASGAVVASETWTSGGLAFDVFPRSGPVSPGPGVIEVSGVTDWTGMTFPPSRIPIRWPSWHQPAGTSDLAGAAWPSAAVACLQFPALGAITLWTTAPAPGVILEEAYWYSGPWGLWRPTLLDLVPLGSPSGPASVVELGPVSSSAVAWDLPVLTATGPTREIQVLPNSDVLTSTGLVTVAGSGAAVGSPALAYRNSPLYVAYLDSDTVVVKSFGLDWTPVGSSLLAASPPGPPALTVTSGATPVVAWEQAGTISVRAWDGGAWVQLGSDVTGPAGAAAGAPSIGAWPGAFPVLAYEASIGGVPSVLVSRWNGASWVQLGGALNSDPARAADSPSLRIDSGGSVLVALADADPGGRTVRVRTFDGTAWIDVGGGAFAPPCGTACRPALTTCANDDVPIVAWSDGTAGIRAYRLNRW